MTDAQLGLIVSAVGILGGAFVKFLHWAFREWISDRKEEREMNRQDRRDDRAAVGVVHLGVQDLQLTLAAMLERDRVRDDRARRESMQPPNRPGRGAVVQSRAVPAEDWDGQTSNVIAIKESMRAQLEADAAEAEAVARAARKKTPAAGVRPPRQGTHHDEG